MKFPCLLLMFCASCAHAQDASESFRQRAEIAIEGPGPFYQAVLPLAVYQGVDRADLADLRVRNGAGETVPYALMQTQATSISEMTETALQVFPLQSAGPADSASGGDDAVTVEVRRKGDDTLVAVRKNTQRASGAMRGLILDNSKLADRVRALRLVLGPNAPSFVRFSLETSNDLADWNVLNAEAQVVRLDHGGQRIENDRIEWEGRAGKYLRILWSDPQHAPTIEKVIAGATRTSIKPAPIVWSGRLQPFKVDRGAYDYALPGKMPLEQLRIHLAQPNSLAPISIQARRPSSPRQQIPDAWERLADTNVYRLATGQGEVVSAPLQLNLPTESRLRLVVDQRGGGLGKDAPLIEVGFTPQVLVFLARGAAPFTLAWGSAQAKPSALPIAMLMPTFKDDKPIAASPARIGAALAAAPAPAAASEAPKQPAAPTLLWLVLLAGVAVLGGMAWLLIRQMQGEGPSQ
jgi:hypothetical protein